MSTALQRDAHKTSAVLGGHGVLLTVCYLAQTVIGTAQPFGLPAEILVPVLAIGTVIQWGLYHWMQRKRWLTGGVFTGAFFVLLCLMAGYDFVRADRFYRTVTAQGLEFWWLIGCMLLIGWYAAGCGRPTVVRTALPVLVMLLISLAALAAAGSYQPENLVIPTGVNWRRAVLVLLEYTGSGEILLWAYWQKHPQPTAAGRRQDGWVAAIWLRFAVLGTFAVLGEMTLGGRFADTPQMFGMLSLISTVDGAGHGGVLYHGVWLTALAVRVSAICCTLREVGADLTPGWPPRRRLLTAGAGLAGSVVLWTAFWRQNCLAVLAAAVILVLLVLLLYPQKAGGRQGGRANAAN